jgi:hypothetical protein
MGIGFVGRAATVSLIGAALLAFPAASSRMAVARADTTLSVVPDRAEPGSTVAVSGSCVEQSSSTTELVLEDQQGSAFESTSVTLDSDYAFSGAPFVIPVGTPPGQYRFVTGCEGRTPFTVVATRLVSPTLSLDRNSGRVGDNVSASGTCPTSEGAVDLYFDDIIVGSRVRVDSVTGAFGPVTFPVPDLAPASYDVETTCEATAPFEVLPPPIPATLKLEPTSGTVGDDVRATGTCPLSSEGVILSFSGEPAGSAELDAGTGAFAVVFRVPAGARAAARVTTDCGGAADFTVTVRQPDPPVQPGTTTTTAPVTTTASGTTTAPGTTAVSTRVPPTDRPPRTATRIGTPGGLKIAVPDLTGMTEDEATAALGDSLVLANPTGHDGQVRRQAPAAGTLVEPASAVTVVLAAESRPSFLPVLLIAALVLAIAAAMVVSHRVRRRRRERRWVDEQVRTDLQTEIPALSPVPDVAVPGFEIRLEVHRHPTRL